MPYISGPAAGKAVYDTMAQATWMLDTDLAHSDNFGIKGTTTITTSSGSIMTVPLIDASGAMLFSIKEFYVEVYFTACTAMLPMIAHP